MQITGTNENDVERYVLPSVVWHVVEAVRKGQIEEVHALVRSALEKPNGERRSDAMDVYVGSRLRIRRKALGMSQENLGLALGLTYQQLQKYENGTNRIGASRLFELSRILKVPIAYFFDGAPEQQVTETVSDLAGNTGAGAADSTSLASGLQKALANPESVELIRAYYRITDPAVRNRMLDLINALASPADKKMQMPDDAQS